MRSGEPTTRARPRAHGRRARVLVVPLEERVEVALTADGCEVALTSATGRTALSEFDALWIRQFDPGAGLPAELDPRLRHAAILESRALLFGVLESVEGFCLDPLASVRRAESKELQLRIAQRLGLDIPRTCITNDPAAARAFVESCPRGAVAKMLEPPRLSTGPDGAPAGVLHTTALDPAMLERLADLRLCPMVFQERLHKRRELRVTVAGRRTFSAELDSASIPGAEVDWHREPERVMRAWRATTLAPDVERRLHALLDALGLQYGAFDLVHTDDERLVFLEVNPGGQYHWLELHAGLPISAAIAEVLAEPSARRSPVRSPRSAAF
jgi:glutathione synthase/RimK-type ligase-like ATP-grasp enzyme